MDENQPFTVGICPWCEREIYRREPDHQLVPVGKRMLVHCDGNPEEPGLHTPAPRTSAEATVLAEALAEREGGVLQCTHPTGAWSCPDCKDRARTAPAAAF